MADSSSASIAVAGISPTCSAKFITDTAVEMTEYLDSSLTDENGKLAFSRLLKWWVSGGDCVVYW